MQNGHKNGNGNGNGYPPEIWQEIEREYQLGVLSVAAISRAYGPSHPAILKRMKRLGLTRNMANDVKSSINHKAMERELQQSVTAENYEDAIERYGELGAGVVQAHKDLFNEILFQCDVTLQDLRHSQGIMAKLANGDRVKKVTVMAASLALKERNNLLRTVAHVASKIVPLQRQAFNMDGEGGGAEKVTYYIVGDLSKPKDAGMGRLKSA